MCETQIYTANLRQFDSSRCRSDFDATTWDSFQLFRKEWNPRGKSGVHRLEPHEMPNSMAINIETWVSHSIS